MTEIEIATESLRKIVTTLNRVIPTSAREEYCMNILFDKGKVVATNGDVIIEIHVPDKLACVEKPFAVNAKILANSVDLCSENYTYIRYTEADADHLETVKLISGVNEFVVPLFKEGPESLKKITIVNRDTYKPKLSFLDLSVVLKYAYPHVALEAHKSYGLTGVHFLSNGSHIRCVGADGKTMAWSYAEIVEPVDIESLPGADDIKLLSGGMVIPRESAAIINDMHTIYKDFMCEFSCDTHRWNLKLKHVKGTGFLVLSGSVVELPFPKIMKSIKREEEEYNAEQVLYVATKGFSDKIKKVSLFSGDDTKRVQFNVDSKAATIRISSYGKGRADVIVPYDKLSFVSADFMMECNPEHILACLGSISSENVQIRCDVPKKRAFIFNDNAVANPDSGMVLSLMDQMKREPKK